MNQSPRDIEAQTAVSVDAPAIVPTAPLMTPMRATMICAVLIALGPISLALYTPAMPTLALVFGTPISVIKLTMALYFAGFAVAQLACGPLSDAFGRRPVNLAFMSLYLAASIAAALAPSIEVLLVSRLVQGIGAAAGVAIARAVIRDLFTGQDSARVMNATAIILAAAPALAPTIGGFVLQLFGWRPIFELMVVYGVIVVLMVIFLLPETNRTPDRSAASPRGLMRSYGRLLSQPRFMAPAITMGTTIGAIYTLTTVLPFVLIDRIGLSPSVFGLTMMLQTGSFIIGSLVVRQLLRIVDSRRLVVPGLAIAMVGGIALAVDLSLFEPSVVSVMLPIALFAFGNAFVMPSLSTAALAPFPQMAGAASAMLGFIQMGGGLVGSLIAAMLPSATVALAIILPSMLTIAVVSQGLGWVAERRGRVYRD